MSSWDSTYSYAQGLLADAKSYYDTSVKASTLKKAWNAAYGLPDYYSGRRELLSEIESYAWSCGIDLDRVSGY